VRFEIVIFDGVDELDAVGPYEVLARAAALTGWSVALVVLPGRASRVVGRYGLSLEAAGALGAAPDVLVVPGGGWADKSPAGIRAEIADGALVAAIRQHARPGRVVAAVCTGAMALAEAGLLRDREASTHHAASADLAATGARPVGARVVDDGDVVTAGGVTSGIDLALWLVERFAGAEVAGQVSAGLEHARRSDAWRAGPS